MSDLRDTTFDRIDRRKAWPIVLRFRDHIADGGMTNLHELLDELDGCVVLPEEPAVALSAEDAQRVEEAIERGGWTDSPEDQALAGRIVAALPMDWDVLERDAHPASR